MRHGLPPSIGLNPPLFQTFSLAEPSSSLWVAEVGGALQGFAFSWIRQRFWFLAQLFVRPDTQSKGIGQAMLFRILRHAEENGAANWALITMAYNTASMGLYIRNGLYPREPLLRLVAPAPLVAERIATAGLEAVPMEPWPGPCEWLGRIDEEVLGFRRETTTASRMPAQAGGHRYRRDRVEPSCGPPIPHQPCGEQRAAAQVVGGPRSNGFDTARQTALEASLRTTVAPHLPPGGDVFAARQAWRLGYASQRLAPLERAMQTACGRASQIRRRLGGAGSGSLYGDFPPRPKGMWGRTYRRLRQKALEAERRVEDVFWERAQAIVERAERRGSQ